LFLLLDEIHNVFLNRANLARHKEHACGCRHYPHAAMRACPPLLEHTLWVGVPKCPGKEVFIPCTLSSGRELSALTAQYLSA